MRIKTVASALVISSLLIFAGCDQSENQTDDGQSEKETAIPVKTGEVETGKFYSEKSVYGKIAPEKQTPIMLEQPAELKTLKVENGDEVKEDDHVATIKTQEGERQINAPKDGIVAQLDSSEGATVSNEDPLMVIVDLDKLTASFSVTNTMRDLFEKGDEVSIYVDDEKYEAKIQGMDTLPNDAGQYPIKANFDNEDEEILPGMSAQLIAKKLEEKDTIIIPTDAVVTETDEDFVFVVDGDKAKKVDVKVQHTQSDKTAVKAAIDEKDELVIEGQHTLADGSRIDIKEGNEE